MSTSQEEHHLQNSSENSTSKEGEKKIENSVHNNTATTEHSKNVILDTIEAANANSKLVGNEGNFEEKVASTVPEVNVNSKLGCGSKIIAVNGLEIEEINTKVHTPVVDDAVADVDGNGSISTKLDTNDKTVDVIDSACNIEGDGSKKIVKDASIRKVMTTEALANFLNSEVVDNDFYDVDKNKKDANERHVLTNKLDEFDIEFNGDPDEDFSNVHGDEFNTQKDDEVGDETVTDIESSIITPKISQPVLPKMLPFKTSTNERFNRGKEIIVAPEGREFVIPQAPTIVGGSSSTILIDYVNNEKRKKTLKEQKGLSGCSGLFCPNIYLYGHSIVN